MEDIYLPDHRKINSFKRLFACCRHYFKLSLRHQHKYFPLTQCSLEFILSILAQDSEIQTENSYKFTSEYLSNELHAYCIYHTTYSM